MDHCKATALRQQQKRQHVCLHTGKYIYSTSAVASWQALMQHYPYLIGGTMHVTSEMSWSRCDLVSYLNIQCISAKLGNKGQPPWQDCSRQATIPNQAVWRPEPQSSCGQLMRLTLVPVCTLSSSLNLPCPIYHWLSTRLSCKLHVCKF